MWSDLQGGRVLRRQVRDERGRVVGKIFRVEEVVGEGEDWKVATVIDEDSMQRCTLKLLTKTDSLCKAQIVNEIKNQKRMSGRPNFIDLLAVYQDASTIYLVMELWGVALETVLTRRKALLEREVQLIFCQLVDILENLRAANISHGNIALNSVLLSSSNIIQLTDFTHSHDLSAQDASDKASFKAGSERQSRAKWAVENTVSKQEIEEENMLRAGSKEINEYISPQEYYDDKNAARISYERDIWACGVLLFKLLTGLFPFTGQGGKLILNKIRFATFSFPSLQQARQALQDDIEAHLSNRGISFLSPQWKELLKRMLSVRNQRITLRELIAHPLKQPYLHLKDVPDLRNSLPQLSLLFSAPPPAPSLFQKAWNINYLSQDSEQEGELQQEEVEVELTRVSCRRKSPQREQSRVLGRDSVRTGTVCEKNKEEASCVPVKNFRLHKTQFGFGGDSAKSIENPRHETVGMGKEKRKEKELSVYTPFSVKSEGSRTPEIVRQPPFVIKFKLFRRNNYLAYILNNAVGVIFEDGQHVLGHTKDDYRYVEEPLSDSQILIDNTDSLNSYAKGIKQSIYKSQSKNLLLRNAKEDSLKLPRKPNFLSEQVSVKNLEGNKYTTSNVIDCRFKNTSLPRQKLNIYLRALEHFGERVVRGALDVWIDRYWRDGHLFVFLLNTGCWQVAFCQPKNFRIYAIDQYGLSWGALPPSSDLLHTLRQIIHKYQGFLKHTKKQSV